MKTDLQEHGDGITSWIERDEQYVRLIAQYVGVDKVATAEEVMTHCQLARAPDQNQMLRWRRGKALNAIHVHLDFLQRRKTTA